MYASKYIKLRKNHSYVAYKEKVVETKVMRIFKSKKTVYEYDEEKSPIFYAIADRNNWYGGIKYKLGINHRNISMKDILYRYGDKIENEGIPFAINTKIILKNINMMYHDIKHTLCTSDRIDAYKAKHNFNIITLKLLPESVLYVDNSVSYVDDVGSYTANNPPQLLLANIMNVISITPLKKWVESISSDEIHDVLRYIPLLIKLDNLSEDHMMTLVVNYPEYLKYLKNPTEKVQLRAVQSGAKSVKFIKNPSMKFRIELIKTNPVAVLYVDKATIYEQFLAVTKNSMLFEYITNKKEVKAMIDKYDAGIKIEEPIFEEEEIKEVIMESSIDDNKIDGNKIDCDVAPIIAQMANLSISDTEEKGKPTEKTRNHIPYTSQTDPKTNYYSFPGMGNISDEKFREIIERDINIKKDDTEQNTYFHTLASTSESTSTSESNLLLSDSFTAFDHTTINELHHN